MKSNESIAMLLKKHTLPNNVYFYEPITYIVGLYDKSNGEFVNEIDCYYNLEVNNYETLLADYVIIKPINYQKLKKVYNEENFNITTDQCISEYANDNSTIAYFASYDYEKNKINIVQFDIDDIFLEDFEKANNFFQDDIQKKPENIIEEKEIVKPIKEKKEVLKTDLFKIEDIYKKVTSSVVAQNDSARRLITEICRMSLSDDRNGILLTGATGVGKTELIKTLGNCIDKSVYIVNSTQLTAPGYVGLDIEEVLYDIYEKNQFNLESAENSIIVFDEIDKKGSANKSDISGKAVLNILLKFLDGTTYNATKNSKDAYCGSKDIEFNTSKMIVIASGAFTDVYKNLKVTQLGFNSKQEENKKTPNIDDFCDKALMPDEFMGRFPIIIHMNDLSVDNLKEILLKSNINPLKSQKEIFKKCGTTLKVTDDFIDAVAQKAYEKKTGARSLKSVINEVTWKALEKVIIEKNIYKTVELTKDTVDNSDNYKLIKK